MTFSVGVGGVRGNDVANPSQRATRADPETGRNYEPKNSREDAAIVKLANSGNDETQKSGCKWIAHVINSSAKQYDEGFGFVLLNFEEKQEGNDSCLKTSESSWDAGFRMRRFPLRAGV